MMGGGSLHVAYRSLFGVLCCMSKNAREGDQQGKVQERRVSAGGADGALHSERVSTINALLLAHQDVTQSACNDKNTDPHGLSCGTEIAPNTHLSNLLWNSAAIIVLQSLDKA